MSIIHGDCVEVMAAMDADSIDAIVTDPPYGLEFMGKEWDRLDAGLPQESVWKGRRGGGKVERDPTTAGGRHAVSFSTNGQGFKRCQSCGKRAFSGSPCTCAEPDYVIEYNYGPSSQSIRMQRWHQQWAAEALRIAKPGAYLLAFGGTRTVHRLTAALEDAGWIIRDVLVWAYAQGFPKSKSSLKPAWEPIVLARKPGPLAPLNIDACRLPIKAGDDIVAKNPHTVGTIGAQGVYGKGRPTQYEPPSGRWPANVVLTDPIFDCGWDGVVGGGTDKSQTATYRSDSDVDGLFKVGHRKAGDVVGYGDTGTYSRFFLIPKASRRDREPDVPGELEEREREGESTWAAECEECGSRFVLNGQPTCGHNQRKWVQGKARRNTHPTVKPTRLMRHLIRLVTPEGGSVLDPFLGSGTTAKAAVLEGFDWVGIEREADYIAIAEQRLVGLEPEPAQLEAAI